MNVVVDPTRIARTIPFLSTNRFVDNNQEQKGRHRFFMVNSQMKDNALDNPGFPRTDVLLGSNCFVQWSRSKASVTQDAFMQNVFVR